MNKQCKVRISDIKRLDRRLNSQSRRIRKLQHRMGEVKENQRYYIAKRLPSVLKREKLKIECFAHLMKMTNKLKIAFRNYYCSPRAGKMYPVFLSACHRDKLRRLLEKDDRKGE